MNRRDFIRSALMACLAAASPAAAAKQDDVVATSYVFAWGFDDDGSVDAQVLVDRCCRMMSNTMNSYNVLGYIREPSWSCENRDGLTRYKLRCRVLIQVDSEGQPVRLSAGEIHDH